MNFKSRDTQFMLIVFGPPVLLSVVLLSMLFLGLCNSSHFKAKDTIKMKNPQAVCVDSFILGGNSVIECFASYKDCIEEIDSILNNPDLRVLRLCYLDSEE